MEKYLLRSLADLQVSCLDLYLIHTPFAVPDTDGEFLREENGDIVLDTATNHLETWKVTMLHYNFHIKKVIKTVFAIFFLF